MSMKHNPVPILKSKDEIKRPLGSYRGSSPLNKQKQSEINKYNRITVLSYYKRKENV